ncbi:hypothetical protein Dimus_017297 [Dionaea muscipula]
MISDWLCPCSTLGRDLIAYVCAEFCILAAWVMLGCAGFILWLFFEQVHDVIPFADWRREVVFSTCRNVDGADCPLRKWLLLWILGSVLSFLFFFDMCRHAML